MDNQKEGKPAGRAHCGKVCILSHTWKLKKREWLLTYHRVPHWEGFFPHVPHSWKSQCQSLQTLPSLGVPISPTLGIQWPNNTGLGELIWDQTSKSESWRTLFAGYKERYCLGPNVPFLQYLCTLMYNPKVVTCVSSIRHKKYATILLLQNMCTVCMM